MSPAEKLRAEPELDVFRSITETCARFEISRQHFYNMFNDSANGLEDLCVRVPPVTGDVRVPQRAFEGWLRGRPPARRKRAAS